MPATLFVVGLDPRSRFFAHTTNLWHSRVIMGVRAHKGLATGAANPRLRQHHLIPGFIIREGLGSIRVINSTSLLSAKLSGAMKMVVCVYCVPQTLIAQSGIGSWDLTGYINY